MRYGKHAYCERVHTDSRNGERSRAGSRNNKNQLSKEIYNTGGGPTDYDTVHELTEAFIEKFGADDIRCDADWEQVPMNQLLVFRNGEHVWSGRPHENEFDERMYEFISLYSAFTAL